MRLMAQQIESCEEGIPKFWLAQSEIKAYLKEVQEIHELITMKKLAGKEDEPSVSSKIIGEWELDRTQIKEILRFLSEDRKLQVTLSNLIGATRFKTKGEDNKLYVTICPKCKKELDEWEHHKICYEVKVPNKNEMGTKEKWLMFIKKYMNKITTETPAKYTASSTRYENFQRIIK